MKRFLECVERILRSILSVLASVGLFVVIRVVIDLVSEEPLKTANMGIVFMVSMVVVYGLVQLLAEVRYQRLEILANELENHDDEAEALCEHLRVK